MNCKDEPARFGLTWLSLGCLVPDGTSVEEAEQNLLGQAREAWPAVAEFEVRRFMTPDDYEESSDWSVPPGYPTVMVRPRPQAD
ncbi:hypothetical protein [Spirillospora sp. CA-128828]|uniref:hypothetical protein n=1 Tax=Spirillospora sp. CA-128828 TaxID=3240033 RepID=UPI003D920D38